MQSKYCHHCGGQMPSIGAKFCPFCGTSLASLNAAPPPPPQKQTQNSLPPPSWANSDPDDPEAYLDRMEHLNVRINKLEIEVSSPPQVVSEKLGSFAGTAVIDKSEFRQGPYSNLTPEQIKEQFAKEAGSRVNETKTHSINVDES